MITANTQVRKKSLNDQENQRPTGQVATRVPGNTHLTPLVKRGLRVTSEFHRLRATGPIRDQGPLRPLGMAIRELMAEIAERGI